LMALEKILILRRLRSGRLEGHTALVELYLNFFTRSFARKTTEGRDRRQVSGARD